MKEILELKEIENLQNLSIEEAKKKVLNFRKILITLPKELRESFKQERVEALQGIDHFLQELALKKKNPELYVENADSLILKELKEKLEPLKKRVIQELETNLQEIEKKALRKIALENEINLKKKQLEKLNDDLRELVRKFSTETTPKGYPYCLTEKVKVILQAVPGYFVDPNKFLELLQKRIKDFSRRKLIIEQCVRITYSVAKKMKEINQELEKITERRERKPKVIAKLVLKKEEINERERSLQS
ncbi:MAG: hypothetical protein DRH33_02110 [Candidatus Nealsonbacteria bacterium]|nr:MAG: hypothetical protein DRH33_02110 [Candidatus Nealsonbacteria bacterium]